MEAEDEIIDRLEQAIGTPEYYQIVTENIEIINEIDSDYWLELFSNGEREEIIFWINTALKELWIKYLAVISLEEDDLFYIGLKSDTLDLAGADDIIEEWEDNIKHNEYNAEHRVMITRRIQALRKLLGYS